MRGTGHTQIHSNRQNKIFAENEKKKKEAGKKRIKEKEKRNKEKNDKVGHPNNPYLTKEEFNKYDLNNQPGLVSQFWIENPNISLHMMIRYEILGKEVFIPYRWRPSVFTHCNIYQPQVPKPKKTCRSNHVQSYCHL